MLTLIPLGINGFIPTFNRNTMSYLLYDDSDELILLDAGTGVSCFNEDPVKKIIQSKKCLNIILSHFHLDHVIGLSYLPGLWSKKPIRLFVPDKTYIDEVGEDALDRLLSPPLFPLHWKKFPNIIELVLISQEQYKIGPHLFQFTKLKHPGGSMGMKIDNTVAYITDTGICNEYRNFINRIPYLMHEVWMTQEEAMNRPELSSKHSSLEDVIKLAENSEIKKLIPIHFNPKWTDKKIIDSFMPHINENVEVIIPFEKKPIIFMEK